MSKQITTLQQLSDAAKNKKAVYCPSYNHRRMAAAWAFNMPTRHVLNMLNAGLYIYEKKPKEKKTNAKPKQDL